MVELYYFEGSLEISNNLSCLLGLLTVIFLMMSALLTKGEEVAKTLLLGSLIMMAANLGLGPISALVVGVIFGLVALGFYLRPRTRQSS